MGFGWLLQCDPGGDGAQPPDFTAPVFRSSIPPNAPSGSPSIRSLQFAGSLPPLSAGTRCCAPSPFGPTTSDSGYLDSDMLLLEATTKSLTLRFSGHEYTLVDAFSRRVEQLLVRLYSCEGGVSANRSARVWLPQNRAVS